MSSTEEIKQANRKLLIKLCAGVLFMFAFCYMLVPMYTLLCKQTGLNGKVYGRADPNEVLTVDLSRTITVQFDTSLHATLPWQFKPLQRKIKIHPGENKKVTFFAENDSGHDMTVQAIPSVAPGLAAKYLKKTECFCFTQQTLLRGQKVEMPVIFHLDREIPKDIRLITLSYTMFDATEYVKAGKKPGRII